MGKGWNIAAARSRRDHAKPGALPGDGEVEYTYESCHGFPRRSMGADVGISSVGRDHSSRSGLYSSARFTLAEARARWGAFTASTLNDPPEHHEAHELLAIFFWSTHRAVRRIMARWHGEIRSRGIRSGFSDALHHQRTRGHDQTSIGLVFAKTPPKQRVITLQLNNHALPDSAGADNFRVEVQAPCQRCHAAQPFPAHAPAR